MYAGPATILVWFTPMPAYLTGSDACSHWSSARQGTLRIVASIAVELTESLLQRSGGLVRNRRLILLKDRHPRNRPSSTCALSTSFNKSHTSFNTFNFFLTN